jgi:glucose dehydrogenase
MFALAGQGTIDGWTRAPASMPFRSDPIAADDEQHHYLFAHNIIDGRELVACSGCWPGCWTARLLVCEKRRPHLYKCYGTRIYLVVTSGSFLTAAGHPA